LKIDQSECSKSPIDLHQSNTTCVVPHSEHPQSSIGYIMFSGSQGDDENVIHRFSKQF
jgi:acyl-CoA synthetase (AMP-forming)/AMP-acid ligase II